MTLPETPLSDRKPVLGVDPPAPKPPEPKPAITPSIDSSPGGVRITQEEYDNLLEHATHYRTILGDDQLRTTIFDYLRKKAVGILPETREPETPTVSNDPTEALVQRMNKFEEFIQRGAEAIQKQQDVIRSQQQEIATLRTDRFSERNPSFEQHKGEVAKILRAYPTMSLEDALIHAEAKAQRASNGTVGKKSPALPTTEGGGAGSIPGESSGVDTARFQEALSKINDPKANVSMDQALDIAGSLFALRG